MNLEESNSFIVEEEKNDRKKRTVVVSIILCSILVAILLLLIGYIKQQDAKTLKLFLNGNQIQISSTLLRESEGKTYINIKEISKLLGYTYTKGGYEQYVEDEKTSCYLTNDYEIVDLSCDKDTFTKYSYFTATNPVINNIKIVVKSPNGQAQKYNLDSNVKYIDNEIYVPINSLPDIINTQVDLSEPNRIKLYSIEQIVANSISTITQLGYKIMGNEYENLKAMIYGYAVVGDGKHYGVISLSNGSVIIGLKYTDITFIPNLKDFLTKAVNSSDENVVGIFASDGSTVIKPMEYDEIYIYDDETQLYLVESDKKYGILNRKGEIVIYADHDSIGYKNAEKFDMPKGTGNYKVPFGKYIIVKDGSKYGLFDIEGNELLPIVYDSLLYDTKNSESLVSGEKSVFIIPEEVGIRGFVICKKNEGYGIYDAKAEKIVIPTVCSKIYSVTKEGTTTYYVEYDGMTLELKQYLIDNNLISINNTPEENTEETSTEPVEEQTENNVQENSTTVEVVH